VHYRSRSISAIAHSFAALALVPCLLWTSQEPATPVASSPAPAADDFAAQLEQVLSRADAFDAERWKRYDATESAEERKAILAQDLVDLFGPELVQLSERAKGTDVAPKALIEVIQLENRMQRMDQEKGAEGAPETIAQRALSTLVSDYLASPVLADLPSLLHNTHELGKARCKDALEKMRAGSPHRSVQAAAQFALAAGLLEVANGDADKLAEARRLFADLQERFSDLSDAGKRQYAQLATGALFEIDHLQVGMTAPDFEAVDEAGEHWKLSEYRGQVVVLDFWGFW